MLDYKAEEHPLYPEYKWAEEIKRKLSIAKIWSDDKGKREQMVDVAISQADSLMSGIKVIIDFDISKKQPI